MINHITKITGRNHTTIHVYYDKKIVTYTEKDNLPLTVVNILLNGDCKTQYTDTGKIERYFNF